MFTVVGFLDGSAYAVSVGGEPLVHGSPFVLGYLDAHEGEPWKATPTGPSGTLDLNDPASVLGALYAWTTVTEVRGEAPDIGLESETEPGLTY